MSLTSNKIKLLTITNDHSLPSLINDHSPKSITILERFSPAVINFGSIDEFKSYLDENEEEMNKLSTVKLNRLYHIDGYRITKLQGKISLRKIHKNDHSTTDDNTDRLALIEESIVILSEKINEIVKVIALVKSSSSYGAVSQSNHRI